MYWKSGGLELLEREGLWNFRLLGVLILPSFVVTKNGEYFDLKKMLDHRTLWNMYVCILLLYSVKKSYVKQNDYVGFTNSNMRFG